MSSTADRPELLGPGRRRRRLADFVREFALVLALFGVYKLGRTLADNEVRQAIGNAWHVWSFERALRLPSELTFQQEALRWPDLVTVANGYYAWVHFPATFGFLIWLWWRNRGWYRWYRTVLVVMTGLALAIHIVYPLAPPRMMSTLGFVDTGALFGPSVYSSPDTDTLTNQFAAMPSLHVGWAVVVAIGIVTVFRSRWRWFAVLHPAATMAVVVATANHYWIDGGVGMILIAPGILVARWHPVAWLRAGRRAEAGSTDLPSALAHPPDAEAAQRQTTAEGP